MMLITPKNPIHLVVLIPNTFQTSSGGAELQVHYISEYLTQTFQNIKVTVLTRGFSKSNQIYSVLSWGGKDTNWPVMEWVKIHKALDIIKPDIIYQRRGNAHTGIVAHYCRKNKIPMIWHVAHEDNLLPIKYGFNMSLIPRYVNSFMKKWGIRKANAIICQTKHQKELLKQNFDLNCDIVLPNVYPTVNEKFTKDRDKINVLWIANFRPFKRPEVFVDLARTLTTNDNIVFHMIGRYGVKKWGYLLKKIKETENLIFHGELDIQEINKLLCKSHLLVNTSVREGFPNTFLQAWMREVPVVSLSVDPDDITKKNKLGFHSGNFEQLKKDVLYLAENPNIIKQIGKNARSYCINKHSLGNIKHLANLIIKLTVENIQIKE